jgi:hypothetical protein
LFISGISLGSFLEWNSEIELKKDLSDEKGRIVWDISQLEI